MLVHSNATISLCVVCTCRRWVKQHACVVPDPQNRRGPAPCPASALPCGPDTAANTTLDQQDPASAPVLCGTSSDSKQTFCSISLLLDIVALCWTSKEARSPLFCGLRSPLDLYWARWLPDTLMDWRKGALCSSISGCTSPLAQCGPRCQPVWETFRDDGVQQPCRKRASASQSVLAGDDARKR